MLFELRYVKQSKLTGFYYNSFDRATGWLLYLTSSLWMQYIGVRLSLLLAVLDDRHNIYIFDYHVTL